MEFRTQIPIQKSDHPIDYHSKVVSLGSCFAVNISEKLDYYQFQNAVNPFGIVFHPLAIEKLLHFAISEKQFTEQDIFFHNERWHCFDAHSDLSTTVASCLLTDLNLKVEQLHQKIHSATHIIITLGTAWAYKEVKTGQYVANCHKVPQQQFVKELLDTAVIAKSLKNSNQIIHQLNPSAQIIFTVSPVRHSKDGFVQNQVSKAHLISALYQTVAETPFAEYFPSYEIMMDELRDYRFYAEDMLHPAAIAIDYIWERFKEIYIDPEMYPVMKEVAVVRKGKAHRPFNTKSEEYKKFIIGLSAKINHLSDRFPFMEF